MNVVCSPWGITNVDFPKQGIMDMANAGFENTLLDFGMWCNGFDMEYPQKAEKLRKNNTWKKILETPSLIETVITPYMDMLYVNQIFTPVANSIGVQLKTDTMHLLEPLGEMIKNHIRLCGKYQCKYIIIPPLSIKDDRGSMWELNKMFYLQFVELAKEQNVMILLSNQAKVVNGHMVRGICSSPYEAVAWIDDLNKESAKILRKEDAQIFGFMLNVAACNICKMDMFEYIKIIGSYLKVVMLSDSDGQVEASLLPFTCVVGGQHQTDWLGVIRGLREVAFDGELIINLSDTAGVFPPLLRPSLLALTKSIGEYFKWQIEIENSLKKYNKIVLFGAGNMCRNYMKCYGDKYMPLFTCDNNSEIWGTKFCGLEVKSPECLKELPEDSAIFICNVYYREIEKQLRDMGIKNRIEFFNDEYMPTYYFDRL